MPIKYLIISLFLLPTLLFGQTQDNLTASQIIDSSLAFCGGVQRISKIESSRSNYLLTHPDLTTAVVNEHILTGKKYVQCILSKNYRPQTTFFNGEKISRVNDTSVIHTTNLQSKEEVRLKTYNQVQYGYKKLSYKLTRLPDKKFKNLDCFVVNAESSSGYITMNFFDKTNFKLLMIVYPNGNKSIILDHIFKDGILFNSHILNTFANSNQIQELSLINIDINPSFSDIWFNCPYTDKVIIPEYIKKGKFASTNGVETTFTRTDISMDYADKKGHIELRRFLAWGIVSPDSFGLIDEEAMKNNDKSSKNQILVRVISWDKNGYVCQWITDTSTDTQDYKLVK